MGGRLWPQPFPTPLSVLKDWMPVAREDRVVEQASWDCYIRATLSRLRLDRQAPSVQIDPDLKYLAVPFLSASMLVASAVLAMAADAPPPPKSVEPAVPSSKSA